MSVERPPGITLKPCPFCGGEAEIERVGSRRQSCIVACTNCGARHESPDEGEQSGASWNLRDAATTLLRRDLAQVTAERDEAQRRLATVLRLDSPWPLQEVLTRLADAADHLLADHDCDSLGHEEIGTACDAARELAQGLAAPAARPDTDWGAERRYVTDDRDYGTPGPSESMVRHELVISMGGNGDWYISVLPEGHKIGPTVRICTSGGASSTHPGLCSAAAAIWRALGPRQSR